MNAGLNVEVIGSGGSVVSAQTIAPGTMARRGGTVLITLNNSDGRTTNAVPNVTGMTLDEADATLRHMGFVPYTLASDDESAAISWQMPDAGVRLPAGARVQIR